MRIPRQGTIPLPAPVSADDDRGQRRSLAEDAQKMIVRFASESGDASHAVVRLARAAADLGNLEDVRLARDRLAIRKIIKFLKIAVDIGDGHAADHRKSVRAREQVDASAAVNTN